MIIDSPIISGSYLSTGSLSQTGNVSITGSLTATGGISGSFSGSGANLFDIPAAGIVGLNLSQIASGSVSASISPNQGLLINTSVSASNFTGSFTGSLTGIATSASYASFALTSSYSLGGSGFPFSGSAVITGSLIVSGSGLTITGSVAISTLTTGSGVRYVIADADGLISAQTASAVIFTTQQTIATAGQTVFPITNGYSTGYVTVFVNGSKLNEDEFTDTSGTNIVFATGSMINDVVEFQKYLPASGVSNNTLRTTNYFTTTLGQTNFTVNYTPGLLDVFYNGAKLSNAEYTAANGTSITLATGSNAGDTLEVDIYSYQVGAFSGIGGVGAANQIAYYNTTNSITGSNAFTVSGSAIIITGSLIVSGSGTFTNIGPAVFSGSVTAVGGFSGSFSGNADSASLAQNSLLLQGTGSVGFTTTASFLAVSSSQQQISASQQQLSSSFLTLTASYTALSSSYTSLSASYDTFSGSASTRITANSSSIQQVSSSQQQISSSLLQVSASYISLSGSYTTFSGSASTRTTQIEQVYATTGSNSFRANQSITGSLVVSSTITAQTLVVQTVTSSIVYSSGSNIFGSQLSDRQTFTGSMNVTGSGTFAGSVTANNLCLTSTGAIYFNEGLALFPYGGHTYIRPYSASGSINFQNQAGSLLATILDGGNVGIGTSSPGQILSLSSDNATGTALNIINTSSGGYNWNIFSVGSGAGLAPVGSLAFRDSTNGATRMVISTSGNVGINCSAPSGKLQVANSSTQYALYTSGGNLELYTPEGNCGYVRLGSAYNLNGVYGSCGLNYLAAGTSNHVFYTTDGPTERMRITSCGFVGINCTDPKYRLDVNGLVNINAQATSCQGTVQSLRISSNIADAAVTINACSLLNYTYLAFAQNCVGKFELGFSSCTDASSPSTFYLNPYVQSGACNAAIFIKSNGRVGIGAAAPSAKLSVAGAISFTADYDSTCPTSIFRENGNKLTLGGGTSGIQFNKSDMSAANVAFLDSGISCFRGLVCAQGGVKFGNGTGTLNYYEQGTWIPRLTNGAWTSNAGASNVGWYTRVGNLVTVGGTIDWGGGSGSQSSNLVITCLPFASSNTGNERNVGQIGAPASNSIAYICSTKGQFVIVSDPNQVSIYIIETFQNGTYASYTHGPTVANAGTIYGFQITYHI